MASCCPSRFSPSSARGSQGASRSSPWTERGCRVRRCSFPRRGRCASWGTILDRRAPPLPTPSPGSPPTDISERSLDMTAVAASSLETPSGKGRGDENFPVGSFLIRRDLRAHVHAFYRFARIADDIADNPALAADDKVRRLDRMAEVLEGAPGDDSPAAAQMRASLAATGVTAQHCHDVLRAFRLDATKLRYADWGELMEYCRYSASPVGRQLLDLHGESRDTWVASDALCSALQVLNHLQDCAQDHRELDRVYVPLDALAAEGQTVAVLTEHASGPAFR